MVAKTHQIELVHFNSLNKTVLLLTNLKATSINMVMIHGLILNVDLTSFAEINMATMVTSSMKFSQKNPAMHFNVSS